MSTAELLLPDMLLIALGAVLCRTRALDHGVWDGVERLVYFVLFPVLLFDAIVQTPWHPTQTARLTGISLAVVGTGVLATQALAWWPGVDAHRLASGAQTAFRFNSYIGLAMAERLGGAAGLAWMALCIGVCVPLGNAAAVWTLARHGGHSPWASLARNPLIVGTLIGLATNLSGVPLPAAATVTLHRIGAAALPLGLMATGASLRPGRWADAPGLSAALLLVRHALLPAAALACSFAWGLAPAQRVVVVLFAALPTSSSTYVLAARMGGDGAYVAGLVTLSTLLGMIGVPGWLWVLAALG
jgi:predicted permease